MSDLTDRELGYLLGLFVGEGTFSNLSGGGPVAAIGMHARDAEVIEWLHSTLGGHVSHSTSRDAPILQWRLTGLDLIAALPLFDQLPPSYKRTQYLAWKQTYKTYFENYKPRNVSAAQQDEIYAALALGMSPQEVAARFNMTVEHVRKRYAKRIR